MKTEIVKAWHFVGEKLRNGDEIPPDGEWLEYNGSLIMCRSGLHASLDPYDALIYAPGSILCRVECGGEIIYQSDKLVCSKRRIIARKDATEGLYFFARMQALSVAHLWEPFDIVLDYLMTGDAAAYAAAHAAAHGAAYGAAYTAAYAAANGAAYAAAYIAAHAAADGAAHTAAYTAANAVAYAVANGAARSSWNELVTEAFGE